MTVRSALLALAVLAAGAAQARDYPTKPVRVVFGIGAGGVGDGMARLVNERVAAALKQPFVLEHRP